MESSGAVCKTPLQLFLCSFVLPDAGIRLPEQCTCGGILRLGLKIARENSYRFVGVSVRQRGLCFSECFLDLRRMRLR